MLIEATSPAAGVTSRKAATATRKGRLTATRAVMFQKATPLPQPVGPTPTDDDSIAADEPATEAALATSFKLLADETRLRVLMALLREGESHVSALCERLGQSQPAVSHHLALLREAEIVEVRREGKHNFYSVRRSHFERVMGGLFESMLPQPDA